MRKLTLPLMMAASLSLAAPVCADTSLGDMVDSLAQTLLSPELDKRAYIAAQNANTARAYRDYLVKYPKGIYRGNALAALAAAGEVADPSQPYPPRYGNTLPPPRQEAALGLRLSEKIAIQRRLTALGYNTHGTDGIYGPNTRRAISNWQRANFQPVTSYLTETQARLLLGKIGPVVTPPRDDGGGGLSSAQVEAALGLTRSQRIEIQRQLTAIGYNTGIADGLWGSNTRTAIARWQTRNSQSATGYVTNPQVRLIARQAGQTGGPPPLNGAGSAALEESLLNLMPAEKADLQLRLTRLGYTTYSTDGVFGRTSRDAIGRWQSDEGLVVTGYLTADQVRLLRVETGG